MAMTVLDSTDTIGILADAGVELEQPAGAEKGKETPEAKPSKEASAAAEAHEDPDDIEGEDGLTPRQKREFSASMQKTIGKKHRMLREAEEFAAAQYSERKLAEQRAAALEARAAELEREYNELKNKVSPPAKEPEAPQKPDRSQFASESEYVDAMIQWGVDQRLREKAEEDRKAREERQRAEMIAAAESRIKRAAEIVSDFREVVGSVDTEVPPAIAGYMQKSEMFAEIAYHLAKNPDVLVSLAKLAPDEQLVKIGRIESTLSPFEPQSGSGNGKEPGNAESDGKPSKAAPSENTGIDLSKPRGKAAPVITPLDATGSGGISKDSKDMNVREAIEEYAKRNRVNLGMRKRH